MNTSAHHLDVARRHAIERIDMARDGEKVAVALMYLADVIRAAFLAGNELDG